MMIQCKLKEIKGCLKRICLDYYFPCDFDGLCAIGFEYQARNYGYWLVVAFQYASGEPVDYICYKDDVHHIKGMSLAYACADLIKAPRMPFPQFYNEFRFLQFRTLEKLQKK